MANILYNWLVAIQENLMAQAVQFPESDANAKSTPAAYLPFRTFLGAIDALQHGIPKQIDRTIWRSQSGVVQSQILMAMRFFGLVDDQDRPTPALHRLVDGKDKRVECVAALLRHAYREIVDRDLTKMTPKMLEDAMEAYSVTGETKRKAVTFFLQAAKYAEIPMHPLLSGQVRNSSGQRRKRVKKESGLNSGDQIPASGDGASTQQGQVRTLELKSGGKLTLGISVDVFLLSESDRTFVFGLIDQFRKYKEAAPE